MKGENRPSWKTITLAAQLATQFPGETSKEIAARVAAVAPGTLGQRKTCKCSAHVFEHLRGFGLCKKGATLSPKNGGFVVWNARVAALEARVAQLEAGLGVQPPKASA